MSSIKARVENWFEQWFGWLLGGVLLCIVLFFVVLFIAMLTDHSEENFLAECSQHEPHYQCVAKWRAGETRDAPTPIVIPVSR